MKINEYFEREYLTAGKTYDNFVFENCPDELLDIAITKLLVPNNEVKPCVVYLNSQIETQVGKILSGCEEEFQKQILARDFVTALVVEELLKYKTGETDKKEFLELQIFSFFNNDLETVKNLHPLSFMPHDIKRLSKDLGRIELSFILNKTENKYIQQAINNFISSREPYSVKIFTNNKMLSSYYDQNGSLIECPHDFMRRDINSFLESENAVEKE